MKWIKAGLCVHLNDDANRFTHLYVVLTEPQGEPPNIAIVNLTSHKHGVDETVMLEAGEHSFIKRKTVVNYAAAKLYDATRLEQLIEDDLTIPHREHCSSALLKKIRNGLLNSPFVSLKVLRYCQDKF